MLAALGWLYVAYIKNINEKLKIKDEQLKLLEKNYSFWKDKANDLEKRSPEAIESILNNRIEIHTKELVRLSQDAEKNSSEIEEKNRQINQLKSEVERTKYFSRALTYYDSEIDDEVIIPENEVDLIELGEVFVDSASLMITDPCYIDSQWQDLEYKPLNKYKDINTGEVYQHAIDFQRFDETHPSYNKKYFELINEKTLILIEEERPYSYSYAGSAYATSSKLGYGELPFKAGESGAGFSIKTVYGDGVYKIMGEKYKGDIIRIYIDLQ